MIPTIAMQDTLVTVYLAVSAVVHPWESGEYSVPAVPHPSQPSFSRVEQGRVKMARKNPKKDRVLFRFSVTWVEEE